MAIRYGKIDFEGEALSLYQSDERERLFSEAYERCPKYQDAQLFDAADYIWTGSRGASNPNIPTSICRLYRSISSKCTTG
jgi:hypothetical protein